MEFAKSGNSVQAQHAPQLRLLLAEAVHADRQLKMSLCALAQALQSAQVDPNALRLPSDLDQWLAERVTLRPLQSESLGAVATRPPTRGLTGKELQVIELLARGYSNDGMARQLFISESTVRTHLRSINCKLKTRSRTEAIAIARRLGLVA